MPLGVFTPVLYRVQKLRIQACQAGQILGIHFIRLLLVGVDKPQFASIGHQDLVAALLQHPANPGRVGSRFYGYAQRLLEGEASSESLWGGT